MAFRTMKDVYKRQIEHTVDNVSQGSRQDQRHTDDKSGLHALLHELVQKPANDREDVYKRQLPM